MLSPDYLQHVADSLETSFANLETEILEEIAARIKANDYTLSSTSQWQLEQLKKLGESNKVITEKLSKALNVSYEKVAKIVEESTYMAVNADNEIIKRAHKNVLLNERNLKDVITDGIQSLNNELENITGTTAVTAQKVLQQALNKAYLQIQSGAFTEDQAMKNVIEELGRNGLGKIEYRSGADRQLDTTVRTAVRTAVSQTATKAQEKNLDDMDINLVETTSHWGARPTHAEWQGKVFWRKKEVDGYQNFYDVTGYGTGAGLGGWNCRHSFYPYFEDLSSQSFEHHNETKNEEYYERTQEQRYYERKIREWKRRQAVNKAGGIDSTREARKVREWKQRQSDFLKAHPELKRDYSRETVEKRTITAEEPAIRKNNRLLKGYNVAVKKGDISSFITFDIYKKQADEIEKKLVGIKAKNGIMIKGYKMHFVDRQIGQYESSNEPIKELRKGVSIDIIKECLQHPKDVRKKSKTDWNYMNEHCKVTVNPKTGMLVQANPYKRKKAKK